LSQIVLFDLFRTALLHVFFSSAPCFSTGAAPKTLVQDKGGVLEHLKKELLIQFFFELLPDGDRRTIPNRPGSLSILFL